MFLLFYRKFRSRSPTPSYDDKYLNSSGPRKWRKVLYDRDPNVPDNYAPREFFLAAIERNKNLHKYSFGACVKGSAQVSLQVFAVLLLALATLQHVKVFSTLSTSNINFLARWI